MDSGFTIEGWKTIYFNGPMDKQHSHWLIASGLPHEQKLPHTKVFAQVIIKKEFVRSCRILLQLKNSQRKTYSWKKMKRYRLNSNG